MMFFVGTNNTNKKETTMNYTAAQIKVAMKRVAHRFGKATLVEAIAYLDARRSDGWTEQDEFDWATPEEQAAMMDAWNAEQEAEMRAEFTMSWVNGGGLAEDAGAAYAQFGGAR